MDSLSDYMFEELSVQLDVLQCTSSFHIARYRILTPETSGIHVYDTRYRRFSLPAQPVGARLRLPSRQSVKYTGNMDRDTKGSSSTTVLFHPTHHGFSNGSKTVFISRKHKSLKEMKSKQMERQDFVLDLCHMPQKYFTTICTDEVSQYCLL